MKAKPFNFKLITISDLKSFLQEMINISIHTNSFALYTIVKGVFNQFSNLHV